MDKLGSEEKTVIVLVAVGLLVMFAYMIAGALSKGPHMRKIGDPETLPPPPPPPAPPQHVSASPHVAQTSTSSVAILAAIVGLIAGAIGGRFAASAPSESGSSDDSEVDRLQSYVGQLESEISGVRSRVSDLENKLRYHDHD